MQEALEGLVREAGSHESVPELSASHLYVRFLPKTSKDLETLWNLGEELYLYPLDYEIKQWGLYYQDPSLGENDYPYVYAVVPVDFVFPDMQHEILAECYIPDLADSDVEGTSVSGRDLELKAYGPLQRNPDTASKASAGLGSTVSLKGSVTVDTGQGKLVPLRGAKVRCRTFLREAEAILSDDGSAPPDKKGICDLGENWAYANERYCGKQFGRTRETCSSSEWFFSHYKQLDDILNNGKMTRSQMYWHLKKADGQPCLTFEEYFEAVSK